MLILFLKLNKICFLKARKFLTQSSRVGFPLFHNCTLLSPHLLLLYYSVSALKRDNGTGREGWALFSWVQGRAKCSVFSLCLLELSQHYSTSKMVFLVKNGVKVVLSSYQLSVVANLFLKSICWGKWELMFCDPWCLSVSHPVSYRSDHCQFRTLP